MPHYQMGLNASRTMAQTPIVPAWKRTFDIAVAVVALFVASPLVLLIAISVRLFLGKPVLFRQLRPGLGGRPFTLYKCRTMGLQSQSGDLSDAQRLTGFGNFLRQTSLDELPELWNVLRGDMSLVGPRPLLMEYLDRYSADQQRRHEVLPGITGWAQVNGRNATTWEERLALDVWYVDHQSFWLDLKILFLTVPQVLKRQDIRSADHATMPEFMGSTSSRMFSGSDRSPDASLLHCHASKRRELEQRDCGEA